MFKCKNKKIRPSKHFVLGWMRKWDWDIDNIKDAIDNAYKIEKVGKIKYEAYIRHSKKSKKLIFAVDGDEIFVITGAEGK